MQRKTGNSTRVVTVTGYEPDEFRIRFEAVIKKYMTSGVAKEYFAEAINQELSPLETISGFLTLFEDLRNSPDHYDADVLTVLGFINAVISEMSFDKISKYIDYAKRSKDAEIIVGGNYDKSKGYFIEPTVIKTTDPKFRTMSEEIFGPVVTVYVYKDNDFNSVLELVDSTSDYALTGAVYSQDRYALDIAMKKLENSAGNFYINDKPTGAVVGQQPFGGARGSGTNDKAGSYLNLLRWVSPRTIKEALVPAKDYRYPFLG